MPGVKKAVKKAPAKPESIADNEPDAEPTAPPGCVPFNISGKDMEKHNLKNGNHHLHVGGIGKKNKSPPFHISIVSSLVLNDL
jgi:hypothetical protein